MAQSQTSNPLARASNKIQPALDVVYKYFADPMSDIFRLNNPVKQFAFYATASSIIVWLFRPESMFLPDRNPRSWSFLEDSLSSMVRSVLLYGFNTCFILLIFF